VTSVDIGVREAGTESASPVTSLKRNGSGVWSGPTPNDFGACNDNDVVVIGPVASVVVTPATATATVGGTQLFTAAAFDAANQQVPGTTFTWSSGTPAVASFANPASGLASANAPGDATITATADGTAISGNASLHVDAAPPPATGDLVISQVFGGGGNAGSVFTNDFIEIFNHGDTPVTLTGWSVQYTSADGSGTWAVTPLVGLIQPHSYYLVREAVGSGGTTLLPTPDALGSISMAAGAGKVILSSATTALTGACPSVASVIDRVGYGANSSANGCGPVWGGRTENLSSTLAAFRRDDGCFKSGSSLADFVVQGPAPRNGTSALHLCTPPSAATIVINELMADPLNAAGGPSWGEWFEVRNTGAAPVDLQGWTISSGADETDHVITSSVIVPPGGYRVLGRGFDPIQNGGITLDYNYFTGSSTIFLDGTDFLALRDASGGVVDVVYWSNSVTFVKGITRGVRDATADNSNVGGANWGHSTTTFGDGDFGTPGADNGTLADTPPVIPNIITFSGRVSSAPPLPIGFEDQLFANERDGLGNAIVTTFTWTSLTPAIASIDANGVMHALTPGSATFQATAADGTTGIITLPMAVVTAGATAQYGNSTEFGVPVDGSASDDFILTRAQYTASYSNVRNTSNWVAYNLEASHFGGDVDRCDCFTADPFLPASFFHYTTADYTGAGAIAGFGIDRGHLARSFDRTAGELDNAFTYLFSNIIPQASDLNQGPWAVMENFLGDQARFSNKEVYIVAGVAGNKGTVKNEGKIVIPEQVWKVAVIMPHDKGLADVHDYRDLEVIAVIMPNIPGVRNVDWHTYVTTVDAVEALSGYDLLSLLPDKIETAVESNTKPPIGALDGPYAGAEGSSISMSAAASVDPNGTITSYVWTFGDGGGGSGASITHTYAQNGIYTVELTLTDNDGLTDIITTTTTVTNVAPTVNAFAGASLETGQQYSVSGTFTDPGADTWSATVNYGDGSGVQALSLSGMGFQLQHTYTTPGTFTVTVVVSDGEGSDTRTASVTQAPPRLTALGAAKVWIGLKNSDDVGLRVDLRTEVLVDGVVVGSAEASNVATGSSGFNNAQLNTLALALTGTTDVPAGTQVAFRPSVRRTCSGGGHASGTVRFWFGGAAIDAGATRDAGSRFGATVDGGALQFYARASNALTMSPGSAKTSVDIAVNSSVACPARPFTSLGTWSLMLP
jgi:DNA/RNA endonuclease G (NUC1)/PKD repeat protein